MKIKKLRATVVASVLVASMLVIPVSANPLLEEQRRLEQERTQTAGELQAAEDQLFELMEKYLELQMEMTELGERIIQTEEDLVDAEELQEDQRAAMALRIVYMFENGGSANILERILNSGSIAELLNQAEYIQSIHQLDRTMLNEYIDTVNKIITLNETLEAEMEVLQETEI